MKLVELVALAIRILGIHVLITFVRQWGMIAANLRQGGVDASFFIFMAIYLALIIFLITFPIAFAKRLVPRTSLESAELKTEGTNLEHLALSILGIYILAISVPALVTNAIHYLGVSAPAENFPPHMLAELRDSMMFSAIQIFVAAYLLLGTPSIVRLLHRIRALGAN